MLLWLVAMIRSYTVEHHTNKIIILLNKINSYSFLYSLTNTNIYIVVMATILYNEVSNSKLYRECKSNKKLL